MWLLWLTQLTDRSLSSVHISVPPSSNPATQLPTTATRETLFPPVTPESHSLESSLQRMSSVNPFPKLASEPCPVKITEPSPCLITTAKNLHCNACVAPLSQSWYSQQQGFQPLWSLWCGISTCSRLRKNGTQTPCLSGFGPQFRPGPEKFFSTEVSLKWVCSHGNFQFQLYQHFLWGEKKNKPENIQSYLDKFANIYPKKTLVADLCLIIKMFGLSGYTQTSFWCRNKVWKALDWWL